MKQYTTLAQTAKLIELGFEKPKSIVDKYYDFDAEDYRVVNHYSLGELIEMLPLNLDNPYKPPLIIDFSEIWRVYYGVQEEYSWEWSIWFKEERPELIDALYDMCVKLKEEGVI